MSIGSESKGKRCYFGGIGVGKLFCWVDWGWYWMLSESNGENDVMKEVEMSWREFV